MPVESETPPAEPADSPPPPLPPAPLPPEAFTERAAAARRRGLKEPYIGGGTDPELDAALAAERPYVRALIVMTVLIVTGGFILGIAGVVISQVFGL
jgi:hypothetical protein